MHVADLQTSTCVWDQLEFRVEDRWEVFQSVWSVLEGELLAADGVGDGSFLHVKLLDDVIEPTCVPIKTDAHI